MKKLFSLLLSLLLVMSLALPAYASGGSLGIRGKSSFTCSPGISNATDLFDEQFKGVMPGDRISEVITIWGGFNFTEDTLKVYMRALTHDDTHNKPITNNIGNVADMNDFLNQLTLRVYNLSKNGKLIFEGKANELDGLKEKVYLGSFRKNNVIRLKVELEVPIELDNRYAHRIGEVDWEFTIEAFDDPAYDNPKTGDYIMMSVAVMLLSAAALVILLAKKRKKN